jgi:hypothetical protein
MPIDLDEMRRLAGIEEVHIPKQTPERKKALEDWNKTAKALEKAAWKVFKPDAGTFKIDSVDYGERGDLSEFQLVVRSTWTAHVEKPGVPNPKWERYAKALGKKFGLTYTGTELYYEDEDEVGGVYWYVKYKKK